MYIVKFSSDGIDRVLDDSKDIFEFIINIHKEILTPEVFDNVKQLGDFIYCNEETGKIIAKKVIDKYGVNGGLNWMNRGFSLLGEKKLEDFEFDIGPIMSIYNGGNCENT